MTLAGDTTVPRILVIDGNRAATREKQMAAGGQASGEGYVRVLEELAAVDCDIVRPADGAVSLPVGVGLADYDGVAMTGSALNVYDSGPHVERQIELVRAVFASEVPFFGSCWGLQVAVTAAGGRVRRNPLGREFGFGRRITLNAAGLGHPLYTDKPPVFEAITVHLDCIEQVPDGAVVLASNEMGVQAMALRDGRSAAWGVQYHPEYSYAEIAATALRYGDTLLDEGLFATPAERALFVAEMRLLMHNPRDHRLTWKHGLGPAMRDPRLKLAELRNWLQRVVEPRCRERDR